MINDSFLLTTGRDRIHIASSRGQILVGTEQWMIDVPRVTHEGLEYARKSPLGDIASVTEQTGAWVPFDITGTGMQDTCERLCAVPFRSRMARDARIRP